MGWDLSTNFVPKVCPTFLISLNGSHAKHLKAQLHLMNQFQNILFLFQLELILPTLESMVGQ